MLMASVSFPFFMAMLHSLWQAGLLMLLYLAVEKGFPQKNAPLDKRNILFVILASQFLLFVFTFSVYFRAPQTVTDTAIGAALTGGFFFHPGIHIIAPWLSAAYIIIISYKITASVYSWMNFHRGYKNNLVKPAVELRLFTALKAQQFGIKKNVKLWLSNTVTVPVTFGFFKPVILLPVALLNQISMQQAETLILHELTHIRFNDYLLNWFLVITETVFFYNPFIKSICKKIRMEREMNCDLGVLSFNYAPAVYAETLLKAEQVKQQIPVLQLAAVDRKKQLLHRIHFFTACDQSHVQNKNGILLPVIAIFLLLSFFSAFLFNTTRVVSASSFQSFPPVFIPSIRVVPNETFNELMPVNKFTNNPAKNRVPVIENQVSARKKPVAKTEPSIIVKMGKADLAIHTQAQHYKIPVSLKENESSGEVIIKEENSGTNAKAVKVYRLVFDNGKWILVPEWMATAKEITGDNLIYKMSDSTFKKVYPPQ